VSALTRRQALGAIGAAGALAGLPRLALAGPMRPRLVALTLQGGLDGLAALPPHGDPHYAATRGPLALQRGCGEARLVDLDGFFGLHPALAPLRAFYERGECLALPAVATSNRDRSHAAAQAALRRGAAGCGTGDWVQRAYSAADRPAEEACADETAAGRADLVADLCLGAGLIDPSLLAAAAAPVHGPSDPVAAALGAEIEAFRKAARRIGERLADPAAPPILRLVMAGFDTHAGQGAADGRLAAALAGLADGLGDLARACGAAWRDTIVMVVTEFGRSAAPNRLGGTDHGTAGAMVLVGGAVAGGRVLGTWPGLASEALLDGRDLAPTTEFRAVAKGLLRDHVRLPEAFLSEVVFPGSDGIAPLGGLVRA
jgi:uncharacterized protein (DUF1501 family)